MRTLNSAHCFVKFDDKKLQRLAHAEMHKRLIKAAILLLNGIRDDISLPTQTLGPSKPGEPPHRDTSQLWNSLFWQDMTEPRKVQVIVGTNLFYGAIHEFGERPFLRPAVLRYFSAMRRVLTQE
ncbi:MAG: hypothetical protein SH850_25800 [Planctomycetaceae bacterium]|nr:hypothetical protein [Planctomycetaceae bacterium]